MMLIIAFEQALQAMFFDVASVFETLDLRLGAYQRVFYTTF